MPRFRLVLVMLNMLLLAGCSSSVLDLRDALDLNRRGYREKLADRADLAQQFLACTRTPHDQPTESLQNERRSGLPAGESAAGGPSSTGGGSDLAIRRLIDRVRTLDDERADSLESLADVLTDLEQADKPALDLTKLGNVVRTIRRWHAHLDFDEDELARDTSRFARLLLAYNQANFGDFTVRAEPSPAGAGLRGVAKVTSGGFIDRNGNAWLFPGLSSEVGLGPGEPVRATTSAVDSKRIASDLVRVFLEAFFDSAFRVPAVRSATALTVSWRPEEAPYPHFDADHPAVPLEAFARISRDAFRAEAAVTSMVGHAARGASVFGTNNETLVATIETAGGVIAKKLL
jgi:hypothetical protein